MTEKEDKYKSQNKWAEKNREQSNYLKHRSGARNFILKRGSHEDLQSLKILLEERLQELEPKG